MYFDNVSCFSFATRFTHLQNILLSQCFLRLRNKTYNTWFPWQPGIFWDGTISKINQWMKLYMYANFHACIQKCTILALIRRTTVFPGPFVYFNCVQYFAIFLPLIFANYCFDFSLILVVFSSEFQQKFHFFVYAFTYIIRGFKTPSDFI